MTQYIDKAVLVEEMKRRIFNLEQLGDRKFIEIHFPEQFRFIEVYEGIIDFINTLEVKEVDLEEELNHWQGCEVFPEGVNITPLPKVMDIVERTAKHFFELGLKAQKGE